MESTTLGVTFKDAQFIERMVENRSLSLSKHADNLRKYLKDIHTGHFLYLAYVYGRTVAGLCDTEKTTINFTTYAKN